MGRGRITVTPGFLFLMAWCNYADQQGLLLPALAGCALHELGHLAAIWGLGGSVRRLRLTAVGAEIQLERPMSYPGELAAALAGPAANLALAVLGALVFTAMSLLLPVAQLAQSDVFYYFYTMFLPMFSLINLYLMFFNLLPIPPLDGSSIFAFFLPKKYLPQYYKVQRYAMPVFLVVVLLVPYVLHFNPIGIYLDVTAGNVFDLLFSFAG